VIAIMFLVGIITTALCITFGYIKFLGYLERKYPTYVGEGLRNRVLGFFTTGKQRRCTRDYQNKEIIPANVIGKLEQSLYKSPKGIVVNGVAQNFICKVEPRSNSHHKDDKAKGKNGNSNPKDSIPIQQHTETLPQEKESVNQNGTLPALWVKFSLVDFILNLNDNARSNATLTSGLLPPPTLSQVAVRQNGRRCTQSVRTHIGQP